MRVVKGCPRTCSYCVVPGLEGRKVTHYQKDDIIKQFQEFYALGYTNYMFWDSNLLFGKENLFKLFDYMCEYGYHNTISLDFSYGLEFALIDNDFITRLKRFKLKSALNVPLESAEYELYKSRFHRPNNHLGVITETVQRLQDANFNHMHFYVMLGLPNQTLEQVIKTVIFGWRLGLAPFMMLYTPIPGTEDFPKYLEFYKDLKSWELNPFLYPCESEELTIETLLFMHELNFFKLRHSKEKGFFLEGPMAVSNKPLDTRTRLGQIYFNDQNPIMKRIKELIYEEEVGVDEVDDKTLRFLHAINL
jgi:radical SAM superfamily enzyme YgiQ (UPF0313 family)